MFPLDVLFGGHDGPPTEARQANLFSTGDMASRHGSFGLKGVADGFDQLGVPWRQIDRDGLDEITGTRFYQSGVRADGSALVQPAAMMRGLASTLPINVTLYEESPVMEIITRGGFRLVCPDGTIEAKQVVLANHVFAEELSFLKHRIVPLASFASLTRPLTKIVSPRRLLISSLCAAPHVGD